RPVGGRHRREPAPDRPAGGLRRAHEDLGLRRGRPGHAGHPLADLAVRHPRPLRARAPLRGPVRHLGAGPVRARRHPRLLHAAPGAGLPRRHRGRRPGHRLLAGEVLPDGDLHDAGVRRRVRVPDRADLPAARRHRGARDPAPRPALRDRRHLHPRRRHHALGRPDQHADALGADGPVLRGRHPDRRGAPQAAGGEGGRVSAATPRSDGVGAGARGHPFELDEFQRRAIAAIDEGASVLVAAPTGAGKTVAAEHAVDRALAEGGKAFYTTPITALSNQTLADLARRHGPPRAGRRPGATSINGDAPVVVMTTEVLRNMIYASSPALEGLRFVVLDEVHYLQDAYRGPVWEEVIIHLPPSVALVCLSATVSNAEEVAEWLTTVRGDTRLILEERRPVELQNLYLVGDRQSERPRLLPTLVDGRPNEEAARLDQEAAPGRGFRRRAHRRPRRRLYTPRRPEVVELLRERDMLPALYFIFSRAGCEDAVEACLAAGLRLTTHQERARIREIVAERTAALTDDDLDVLGFD